MDAAFSSSKPLRPSASCADDDLESDSDKASEIRPDSDLSISGGKLVTLRNRKKNKRRNFLSGELSDAASTSTSSFCSAPHSLQKGGFRIGSKKRKPKVLIGSAGQKEGDLEALALPLGMSVAAVIAQVLERRESIGGAIAIDHLSEICTLAVRESLANVFGDNFNTFARNFEKSFRSTLMTLRLINESSLRSGEQAMFSNSKISYSNAIPPISRDKEPCFTGGSDELGGIFEASYADQDAPTDLSNGDINSQLALVSRCSTLSTGQGPMVSTLEKSVSEQIRANDLMTIKIGVDLKKLRLKEEQLALNSDSNFLERSKLSMNILKSVFKVDKFKYEVEETRHAELLRKCIDCLVSGLVIMIASIGYGSYVYSRDRITEATASCMPLKEESKSWWIPKPMSSFNSGMQILWCQFQIWIRMLFGILMILAISYLLLQRSMVSSTHTMPITFILLLGLACGFAGKLCMDALGGSGYHWVFFWELQCLVHFLLNVFTPTFYLLLHGPVNVSREVKGKTWFPYWMRRVLFYTILLVFLPMLCGLIPFATLSEWKDHFKFQVIDFLQATSN